MGWAEIAVIVIVGLLVFGPDKLPGMAKQAAGLVRTVRRMADNAKNDLGRELGQDFSDVDLSTLDPREVVRRNLLDAPSVSGPSASPATRSDRLLRPGERPPFDTEAT
ncbi:sec-independent translocase [Aeromicrobium sp. CTD01-1L150]|uniref:sec-independent translocase n=1 Tax=Aeromicrobium sp. CTD01-1L150 TaxID=3341830 RepID=UPI0035C045F6